MSSPNRPSPGVIAAGTSAILAGVLVSLTIALAFTAISRLDVAIRDQNLPPYIRMLSGIFWGAFLLGAFYLIFCGVGVIRLRNWARISLLVFSGAMLFFGFFGIFVLLFMVLATSMPGPAGAKAAVVAVLIVIYGVPIVVALWWMILFTRRSVVAQFEARKASLPPSRKLRFSKPGCPLPVSVVAWFLLSSVLGVVILPFLPFPLSVIFFGHMFQGSVATLLILVQCSVIAAASVGLLRLQRWSFPASLTLQLFYVANGLITFINPNYVAQVKSIVREMQLPPTPPGFPDFFEYTRYFGWLGLLVPIACIVALFYARDAFYSAASASPQSASEPAN